MALYDIYLPIEIEYKDLINDIYKWLVILFVIHVLFSTSYNNKSTNNFGLTGSYLNNDFLNLVIFILIGLGFYQLVAKMIISIN